MRSKPSGQGQDGKSRSRSHPAPEVTPEAAAGDAHGHPSRLHGVVVVVVGLK